MLDFMVIALPRSGTTWAANWLTAGEVHCVHDPLYRTHYSQWDGLTFPRARRLGVACTGVWRWPRWVNAHPARKLVLHRDLGEIRASLARLGLPFEDGGLSERSLNAILGFHAPWTDLFDPEGAWEIWSYLTGRPDAFDAERHAALVGMNVQPRFERVAAEPTVTRRLLAELQAMAS